MPRSSNLTCVTRFLALNSDSKIRRATIGWLMPPWIIHSFSSSIATDISSIRCIVFLSGILGKEYIASSCEYLSAAYSWLRVTPLESASGSCGEISVNLRSPWHNSIQWSTTALTPVQAAIARSNHNDDYAKIEMTGTKGQVVREEGGFIVIGYRVLIGGSFEMRGVGTRLADCLRVRARVRALRASVCVRVSASSILYVCMRVRIRVHKMETFVDGDTVGCLHDELWYFVPNVHSFRPRGRITRSRTRYAREGRVVHLDLGGGNAKYSRYKVKVIRWSRGAPRNLFICHQRKLGRKDSLIPTNRGESVYARRDGNPTIVSLFSSQGVHSVIRGVSRCSRISPIPLSPDLPALYARSRVNTKITSTGCPSGSASLHPGGSRWIRVPLSP